MSNELKLGENVEKLKKFLDEKKFIEASNCADEVVKENENSGEAWLLYFLAYNSKTSLEECSPYDYSMNEDLINKIENLGDDAIKKSILKFKEKVKSINNFIENKEKINNLSAEIMEYAKYAYGEVGEDAIKALECVKEIKNDIKDISISADYKNNYNESPLQIKMGIKEVINTKILDDVNNFLNYNQNKRQEILNSEKKCKDIESIIEKNKEDKKNLDGEIKKLQEKKESKNRSIEDFERKKNEKIAENSKLDVEKAECQKDLELNKKFQNEYNGVKSEFDAINNQINSAKRKKEETLALMQREISPLETSLKNHDTANKRREALETKNSYMKELLSSNITQERKNVISNNLLVLDQKIAQYDIDKELYNDDAAKIERVKDKYRQSISDAEATIASFGYNKDTVEKKLNSLAKSLSDTDKSARLSKIEKTINKNKNDIDSYSSLKNEYYAEINEIDQMLSSKKYDLNTSNKSFEESSIKLIEEKNNLEKLNNEVLNEKNKVIKTFESKDIKLQIVNKPDAISLLCDSNLQKANESDVYDAYCKISAFDSIYDNYFLNNSYIQVLNDKFANEDLSTKLNELVHNIQIFENNLEIYHNEKSYVEASNLLFTDDKRETCVDDLKKLNAAENIFKTIESYKDSAELLKLSIYTQGCRLYERKPKKALAKFNLINDYKDSAEWIQKCETLIKERHEALMKKLKIAGIAIAIIAVIGFVVMKLMKYI